VLASVSRSVARATTMACFAARGARRDILEYLQTALPTGA
jgi:hypothetical protein